MARRKEKRRGVCRLILTLIMTCTFCHTDTEAAACGGVFTSPEGVITSPGYPASYPREQDCVYIINRPQGQKVILSFLEFDLEDHIHCAFDVLEIRDGDSESSPYRRMVCGSDLPSVLKSFTSSLWIRFQSDETNTAGGFKITYTSAEAESDNFFLLTAPRRILIWHPTNEGGSMSLPLPGLYLPFAVDYDPVQGRVYWTDMGIREIRSAFLNGTGVQTVVTLQKDALPASVAIDPVSRLLYYAEADKDFIGVVSLVSLEHKTVISGLILPYSVVLDNTEGLIFWIERGFLSSSRISRSRYDGTERKEIISRHLHSPECLAVDKTNKRLYWVDSESQMIEWSDYDGRGRSSQVTLFLNTHFFALTLTDSHLHIVDWGAEGTESAYSVFRRAEKDGSNVTVTGSYGEARVKDIHFHNDTQWRKVSNGCSTKNGDCSHMCIPLPDMGHRCMCPDRQVLVADRRTCRSVTESPFRSTKTSSSSKPTTGVKNLKVGTFSGASSSHFFTAEEDGILEDEDDWEDEDEWEYDDDFEEVNGDKERTRGRGTATLQRSKSTATSSDDVSKKKEVVISKDDYLYRPSTAFVFLTGPRPFDTDGSKLMTLTCIFSNKEDVSVSVWSNVDCIKYDDYKAGKTCLFRPKVPDDDEKSVRCKIYYNDGKFGFASFTLELNYPPPVPPKITGYNSGQVLKTGDTLRMTCTVKGGKPLVSAVDFYCPGHPDTEPDEEGRTEVHATVTIRRLTLSDNGVTCVCSAEWKEPEMYTKKAYVTLHVATDVKKGRGGEL